MKEGDNEINEIKYFENIQLNEKNNIIDLMNIIKKNGLEKEMENNELYKIYKDYLTP